MIKNIMENNEKLNASDKDIAILRQYFPGCFNEDGSFDVVKLQNQINDKVDVTKEGFELNFLGKSYAKLLSAIDTTTVIKPDLEHNSLPENKNSENIYISGDNLDALKHLIKSYKGQIKCIYIDPPYNTGGDGFVYKDKFTFTSQELQDKLSITENEANRILNLTSRGSASHSAWLTFMYPRLKIAHDLLKENGGIFISIDDNELYNLKYICDEIFGPENFVGIAPRKTKGSATTQGDNELQNLTDYVMIYFNQKLGSKFNQNVVGEKKYPYHDERGDFYTVPLQDNGPNGTKNARPNLYYPIYVKDSQMSLVKEVGSKEFLPSQHHHTDGCWMWSPEKFKKNYQDLIIENGKVMIKHYYSEDEDQNKYQKEKLWIDKFYNKKGTDEINSLFEEKGLFSNPKPVELIDWCLKLLLNDKENNIVLDFFGGSGTTAQAVMQFNKNINSNNNKFILVQLPEDLKYNYENADGAGKVMIETQIKFLTSINKPLFLDELGQERIRRAGKLFKTEPDFDFGFKHFTLVEPNKNTLDKMISFDKNQFLADENILNEFGKDTVLTTWLNDDGYGLTGTVEEIDLDGYKAYYKGNHLYLINAGFENKHISALFEKYNNEKTFNPENIILFGYSFNVWSIIETLKTNIKQLKSINKNVNVDVRY